MRKFARCKTTASLVKAPAEFAGAIDWSGGGRASCRALPVKRFLPWHSPHWPRHPELLVRVLWALVGLVIIPEAMSTPGDRPRPASECLAIEAWVRDRLVQVPPGKCLLPELAVVGYPPTHLIVPLCPDNQGLVCEEFRGLMREPCCNQCCHE